MPSKLTDSRVFTSRYVCKRCAKPLSDRDEPLDSECRCFEDVGFAIAKVPEVVEERLDHFLQDAGKVKPIHLSRWGGDAHADIPQRFVYHSPDGFEWGYGGSGPADLALNILALFVAPPEAWRLHIYYKNEIIACVLPEGRTIEAYEVRSWIETFWDREKKKEAGS